MSLNIKSERAHDLARDLAKLTGENMTEAVTAALLERLERVQREMSAEQRTKRILELGRATAARLDKRTLELDHGEFLYDELGLPR